MVADAFLQCVFDNHSTKAYPIQAVATINEIVLTDEQYNNTIGQFHNNSTAGHAGIDRTVKRIHKAGFRGPTNVSLSERTFACAQFIRRLVI